MDHRLEIAADMAEGLARWLRRRSRSGACRDLPPTPTPLPPRPAIPKPNQLPYSTAQLVGGDPADGPASFSRFVLPFRYHPAPWAQAPSEGARWCPLDHVVPKDRQADFLRYFTAETAKALFRRAKHFALRGLNNDCLTFKVPCKNEPGSYRVKIPSPRLVLFEWPATHASSKRPDLLATGFLLIDLTFPDTEAAPTFDDLLELNEIFRYCLPPFAGHKRDAKDAAEGGRRGLANVLQDLTVDICCESKRVGEVADASDLSEAEISLRLYFHRWACLLERPLETRDSTVRLFPQTWGPAARDWFTQPLAEGGNGWVAYADNRAFVWSCAILPDGLTSLRQSVGADDDAEATSLTSWVRFLNVDCPGTASPSAFEQEWADERTFCRWQHWDTVYGFSYHSGVMLAPPCEDPDVWRHFDEIYFFQTLLLLYLRVSSFRFNREMSRISPDLRSGSRNEYHCAFEDLRRDFAVFTNLYQFPLLSNQQQGIELYALARKHLDVDALFDEVEAEVESTHRFVQAVQAERQSRHAARLTVVATVGLLLSVVVGFFGMNILVETSFFTADWWHHLGAVAVAVLLSWWIFGRAKRHTETVDQLLELNVPKSMTRRGKEKDER